MLLDVVQAGGRRTVGGLEMARASTVRARVERILAITALPTAIGWRKRIAIVAILVPVAALAAVTIATRIEPAAALAVAREPEPQRPQRTAFYALRPGAIFAISQSGDQLFGQLTGQRRLRLAAVGEGSYAYAGASGQLTFALQDVAQSPAELALHQNGRDIHAARIAEFPQDGEALDAGQLDEYAGWYALGESRVLAVTHVGERLQLQETGGTPIEVSADWADAFSDRRNDLVMFLRDNKTNVDRLLLLDPIAGARVARRIDAARARAIESEFARRIAQAPDRFRLQVPSDGTKEAVLRGIEDLRRGTPSYDRMSVSLAAKIQHQEKELHAMFVALGATQSIFFRGVGPGGYDIYGVKFANGSAEFRVLLGADGRAEDVLFHPYGNDEPGDVLACSNEHAVRARAGEAPIRMYFYNSSGGDVQFYSLDQDGTRTVHGSVGDNTTWATTTSVGTPWMIADREGKCLEIVLPGQHTRSHKIEPPGATPLGGAQRSTPQDGGEEMLRHYIEAVGRGQPDYDHMTAEVATQTRLSLPFDRAILARLGPLRAMSFRGVSKVGSDIYIVQFANGSAEWRIALASDGSIGRVALGPSY
jgi:hypothetical protein